MSRVHRLKEAWVHRYIGSKVHECILVLGKVHRFMGPLVD